MKIKILLFLIFVVQFCNCTDNDNEPNKSRKLIEHTDFVISKSNCSWVWNNDDSKINFGKPNILLNIIY